MSDSIERNHQYDVIVVGGGPAGSACARDLVRANLRTLILDKARFPRVKLCAGWLSPRIWKILEVRPEEYTGQLWHWHNVLVHFRGRSYKKSGSGYFIRRNEFDHFLLKRSGAAVEEGEEAKQFEHDETGWWVINGRYRCKYLVGAGGSHCPVARLVFGKPDVRPSGLKELEFKAGLHEVTLSRAGLDGEPELLIHDDMRGYSWNVPKSDWLNVGTGTKEAKEVRKAWDEAKQFFIGEGTIPKSSIGRLEKARGYATTIFHQQNLERCCKGTAFLVGDALGLAQPITGEGIVPAVVSGKACAAAIIDKEPETYRMRLIQHPVIRHSRLLEQLQKLRFKVFPKKRKRIRKLSPLGAAIFVQLFVWLFSGKSIYG